jgi:hypothetical protein
VDSAVRLDFTGCAPFQPDYETETGDTLLIGVSCKVGDEPVEVDALLDCAAEWSVLNSAVAEKLGFLDAGGGLELTLSTRFGRVDGTLVTIPLTLVASEGKPLTFEVRWFVSEYWYGPTVLGWRGCLSQIRFAWNPDDDRIYFAAAGHGAA